MGFKCLHIADVHFRGLSRHEEYRESFEDLIRQARDLAPDIIYIGGDIVHSKTQGISPELIDVLHWWFISLSEVAPVHLILGNHDGLILNKDRQDAITPIVNAIDPNAEKIHLYKKSGLYPTGIPGFNWAVFSCFDEENWANVKPAPNEVNIALFHGAVYGSKTDVNWDVEGEIAADFFEDYEFAFLGDIHRQQYLDEEERVAYCGSTIQQNYGESSGKGFLFWDIEDKDKFTSTFHEVYHSSPFVTVDWAGSVEKTLDASEEFKDGSRFRIRIPAPVPQSEIKQLYRALREFKSANEVVLKQDFDIDVGLIRTSEGSFASEDLRDVKTHQRLIREYYSNSDIKDSEWEVLDKLIIDYMAKIARSESLTRNTRWSIKRLAFDNVFAYGRGNIIDFSKMTGITGLFGKNRVGKSSIPGALMYGLFNTTDRGPIKNLHVINTRKGHCVTTIDFNIKGQNYRAERQSVKHQTRRGHLHASTHLNLYRIDSNGEILKDLSEEQRRSTEKVLRGMVGTADDFLMTSLASQGEMNNFIKHRATKRKEILANFLDLGVFEQMEMHAKEDSMATKVALKGAPDTEWESKIQERLSQKSTKIKRRAEAESSMLALRKKQQQYRLAFATHKDRDLVTKADLDQHQQRIDDGRKQLKAASDKLDSCMDKFNQVGDKIEKISLIRSQFPHEELKKRHESQVDLTRTSEGLKHAHEREKTLLKQQKKSIKKLQEVPCGNQYPTCKFIKDSHRNKKLIVSQSAKIEELTAELRSVRNTLKALNAENLQGNLEKYEGILRQENAARLQRSELSLEIHEFTTKQASIKKYIQGAESELVDMRLRLAGDDISSEINALKKELNELNETITKVDVERLSLSEDIGLLTSDIAKLREEKEKYKALLAQWRIYDLFMNAISKKGIPLQIITYQLPLINEEISKILQGVVGFTVELTASTSSNTMDVYINYGDSRRIIECASGMEKMMASLAIRVALINISSLPKANLLIIDEGFGALDEMNVEACNRLLDSLRKWFKNILVISHVDGIKDSVDNVLDITSNGKDASVIFE